MPDKFKSGLERKFNEVYGLAYETAKLTYTQQHTYNPDWTLGPDHYIETKGRWEAADRSKIKRVLEEHPNVKVVMVFQDPTRKLSKVSKTSYAAWCDKQGITWFKFGSPDLDEYIKRECRTAVNGIRKEGD